MTVAMTGDFGEYEEIGGERRTRRGGVLVTALTLLVGLGLVSLGVLTAQSLHSPLGRLPPPHTPDPKWDPEPSQWPLRSDQRNSH